MRPNITWGVIDGIIDSDFPKVPEIIVFQTSSADVAWIPREGDIDRFYVKMANKNFDYTDVLFKINRALHPHQLRFKKVIWFSRFSVQESVAEQFSASERVFLVGDAAHIHSVNGGQGLNTGLADAVNLVWKLNMHIKFGANSNILSSYEQERRKIALDVIKSSGALVRSTQHTEGDLHAINYVKLIKKYAGYITGMGIHYQSHPLKGQRLHDFVLSNAGASNRIYQLLDYSKFTLLIFSAKKIFLPAKPYLQVIIIGKRKNSSNYWTKFNFYKNCAILVRPDSFIKKVIPLAQLQAINWDNLCLYN